MLENDCSEEKKMDEVRERRIEVEVHQEKVDFINDAYEKGLWYWKRAALECFNQKWGEGIDWVSTKESDFGSQSKESKGGQHGRDNFLFKVSVFRT